MDVLTKTATRICRFCLQSSVEDQLVNLCQDVDLVFKIMACLSLEVDPGDGLPATICTECLKLVDKLSLFRNQCGRAELLLRASKFSKIPLLENFERVRFDSEERRPGGVDVGIQAGEVNEVRFNSEERRSIGVDVGVQVEKIVGVDVEVQVEELMREKTAASDAGEVDEVVLVDQTHLEDEGWQFGEEEPTNELLIDFARHMYNEDDDEDQTQGDENVQPEEEQKSVQENTISNSEILDISDNSRSTSPSSSEQTDSSDTCSFVSNKELRERMEEMLLADDREEAQPITAHETRNLVTGFDVDNPRKSPAIEFYDLTSSPEPDLPTEEDSPKPKTPSFPEAMRLLAESQEVPKTASSKHNWSTILNRNKVVPQTPRNNDDNEDPLEPQLREIAGIPDTPASPDPETPASPDLDTIFGADYEPISDAEDGDDPELDIYAGCEPVSDEDTTVADCTDTLATPKKKPIVAPDPVTPEEVFDCDLCDKFYPRLTLLETHYQMYHTSPQNRNGGGRMSIVIDNPTRKCPKCGEMVHKASFWAHKKSHNGAERQLINYDRANLTI